MTRPGIETWSPGPLANTLKQLPENVIVLLFFWGILFLIRIGVPPKAFHPVSCI